VFPSAGLATVSGTTVAPSSAPSSANDVAAHVHSSSVSMKLVSGAQTLVAERLKMPGAAGAAEQFVERELGDQQCERQAANERQGAADMQSGSTSSPAALQPTGEKLIEGDNVVAQMCDEPPPRHRQEIQAPRRRKESDAKSAPKIPCR